MNRSHHLQRLIFAVTLVSALPAALPAQVTVLISGGFSAAYQELLPQFEKSTGITVTTARGASQGDGPTTIGAQLRRGLGADLVIMSREGLAELFAEGRIVLGSDVDLASVPMGVGVRAGAAHPDISTVNAFKQTLLSAKSIGIQSSSMGVGGKGQRHAARSVHKSCREAVGPLRAGIVESRHRLCRESIRAHTPANRLPQDLIRTAARSRPERSPA
jgi:hypothetical protein